MSENKTGVELIAAERQRVINVEGYTPEHDARHPEEMARAAACYAIEPDRRRGHVVALWPWSAWDWKPSPDDRVRELVKAGQLIAAEIDRLMAAPDSGA